MGPEPHSITTGYRQGNVGERRTGRGEIINIDDIDGVVWEERLELREEQVQCARKKGEGEEQHALTALALLGEAIWTNVRRNEGK